MAETSREKLRIVFMGTPGFAAAILKSLSVWDGCDIVAVYTQPDRPCGRGQVCKPPETKVLALELGYPVLQPQNFKAQEDLDELAGLQPDLLVVAAYGLILPQSVLGIAAHGAINVHSSLLPKYRGAAPIQRVILDGHAITGVTIMQMDAGMDTGDILMQRAMGIDINETAGQLHDELADLGGRLLVETLERLAQSRLRPIPQDDSLATYAPKLEKSEGEIDWNRPAGEIHNRLRAMHPWPGGYFHWSMPGKDKTTRLSLAPGRIGPTIENGDAPGVVGGPVKTEHGSMLAIACADNYYYTPSVTPAGKKPMTAEAFACGYLDRCETPTT